MKTYKGSCLCGAVKFECEIDLASGTSRCNCAFCRKARFWMTLVKVKNFRLLAGAKELTDYQRTVADKKPFLHFTFCRTCGIRPFTKGGDLPGFGEFYAVNIACLDNATDEELAEAPVSYVDGLHDRWDRESKYTYL